MRSGTATECFAASRRCPDDRVSQAMEVLMLGMKVRHIIEGVIGVVTGVSVDAAGRALVRVNDRWFEADHVVGA